MKKIPLPKDIDQLMQIDSDDAYAPGGVQKVADRLRGKEIRRFDMKDASERRAAHYKKPKVGRQ